MEKEESTEAEVERKRHKGTEYDMHSLFKIQI